MDLRTGHVPDDDVEVLPNSLPLGMVGTWLGLNEQDELKEEEEEEEEEVEERGVRPARLGLGAKYVPHKTDTDTAAGKRLRGKVAGQARHQRREDCDEEKEKEKEEEEEEKEEEVQEDSRTAVVKRKHTKEHVVFPGKRKNKSTKNKNNNDDRKSETPSTATWFFDTTPAHPHEEKEDEKDTKNSTPTEVEGKRKRRKTRSRQKNMRKDKRNLEDRPTYLTPEAANYEPGRPRALNRKSEKAM